MGIFGGWTGSLCLIRLHELIPERVALIADLLLLPPGATASVQVIRSLALSFSLLCAYCSNGSPGVPAQVVGVTGCDTITGIVDGRQIKVRLNGIGAPEKNKHSAMPQKERCLIWPLASGSPSFLPAKPGGARRLRKF
jgi:endonuclease YncB( thermonuclease family)